MNSFYTYTHILILSIAVAVQSHSFPHEPASERPWWSNRGTAVNRLKLFCSSRKPLTTKSLINDYTN